MNSTKKNEQKNPKLSRKGKSLEEKKIREKSDSDFPNVWEHPEMLNQAKKTEAENEMEKNEKKFVDFDEDSTDLEELERNFGDLYEVAPEKLEIEYPNHKAGGQNKV